MSNVFLLTIDSVCGDRNGYVPDVLSTTIELMSNVFLLTIDSVCGDRNGYVPDVLYDHRAV